MEVKSKPDITAVSRLLEEYTAKVFSAVDQPVDMKDGILVERSRAALILIASSAPLLMVLSAKAIGAEIEYLFPDLWITFSLIVLVILSIFAFEYRRTRYQLTRSSHYHIRAISVTLHRVVQYADEIVEHISMEPTQKLELGLRIAEAEGALRYASVILDEPIVEFENHDMPDVW